GDRSRTLKPRVMELLVHLSHHAGEVLSKEHLLDALWKDTFVTENTLMNAVSELRKALGDDTKAPSFITTHSKRGYRLIAPVTGTPGVIAPAAPQGPVKMRLAVLPFMGQAPSTCGPPEPETFAFDGLTTALTHMVITRLAESKNVRVVSRTSSMLCLREHSTLPELVARLNVDHVIEGELSVTSDRVRATVRLYDQDDEGLWGEVLEHASPEPMHALRAIAEQIAERVEEM
ncbi:MAG: winged helix-turn-helix domain-containing protein, partial [Acidobacteriota bacterium]